MTKSDLIDVLCETQKIPKGRAELLVQVIFESMEASLKRGERIEIRGFGSFELRSYRPYEGRNPRTGVRVSVQPKRLPFFKVGKELKERVNAGKQSNGARPRATATATATHCNWKKRRSGRRTRSCPGHLDTGPLTESGATAAAEPVPAGTPTRATA